MMSGGYIDGFPCPPPQDVVRKRLDINNDGLLDEIVERTYDRTVCQGGDPDTILKINDGQNGFVESTGFVFPDRPQGVAFFTNNPRVPVAMLSNYRFTNIGDKIKLRDGREVVITGFIFHADSKTYQREVPSALVTDGANSWYAPVLPSAPDYCRGYYKKLAEGDINRDGTKDKLYQFERRRQQVNSNCVRPAPYWLSMDLEDENDNFGENEYQPPLGLQFASAWATSSNQFIRFRTPADFHGRFEIEFQTDNTAPLHIGDLVHFERGGVLDSAFIHGFEVQLDTGLQSIHSSVLVGRSEIDHVGGIPLSKLK